MLCRRLETLTPRKILKEVGLGWGRKETAQSVDGMEGGRFSSSFNTLNSRRSVGRLNARYFILFLRKPINNRVTASVVF